MNAERQAREQDYRTQIAKQQRNPNQENPLNRPPAWAGQLTPGQIRPAGVEAYSAPATNLSVEPLAPVGLRFPGDSAAIVANQRSPQEQAMIADTNPTNPNSWMGKTGIDHPPPITNLIGSGHEGVALPQTGPNYKGESSYVAPYSSGPGAGNVIEVDPSKDQRFSRMGQTSGQLTAQGIQDKYQTPGTTARITQGNVTDAQGNTMAQNGRVTPFTPADPVRTAANATNPVNGGFGSRDEWMQARNSLQQQHPEVFQAGTAKNLDFADYAQQHGEPAAHAYMQTAYPATASVAPTPSPAPDSAASAAQSTPATNRVNAFPTSKQPPGTQG